MKKYNIYDITDVEDPLLEKIKGLYMASFPENERRPWQSIIDMVANASPFFNVNAVVGTDNQFYGFYTSWNLPGVLYIEHFTVESYMRSRGIGSDVITDVVAQADLRAVVVEVELPGTSESDRRIAFYERNGFQAIDLQYFQPPYAPGLDMVEMILMSTKPLLDVKAFVIMLHTLVYNQ
ncbi:MAG: GNAT family N-acetyltransferase [Muribaculaceae bacterium]|nr:GNAT family N-acetyltransferase [Muribaculaceae bacterium]MDE6643591.1 GNAT family N-acetyltransferase [Muribaculaceae bacterium]